jgi:cytochrome c-type biogenesis protein CcmE
MRMTRKQRRSVLIGTCLAVLAVAVGLMLFAFRGSIVFFYTPSEIASQHLKPGERFRLGGLVATGSVKHLNGATVDFTITDKRKALPVTFTGILPDLFREGQGVVAEGSLGADGVFHADDVLAKHDARYMPPALAAKLKQEGLWKGASTDASLTATAEKKVN